MIMLLSVDRRCAIESPRSLALTDAEPSVEQGESQAGCESSVSPQGPHQKGGAVGQLDTDPPRSRHITLHAESSSRSYFANTRPLFEPSSTARFLSPTTCQRPLDHERLSAMTPDAIQEQQAHPLRDAVQKACDTCRHFKQKVRLPSSVLHASRALQPETDDPCAQCDGLDPCSRCTSAGGKRVCAYSIANKKNYIRMGTTLGGRQRKRTGLTLEEEEAEKAAGGWERERDRSKGRRPGEKRNVRRRLTRAEDEGSEEYGRKSSRGQREKALPRKEGQSDVRQEVEGLLDCEDVPDESCVSSSAWHVPEVLKLTSGLDLPHDRTTTVGPADVPPPSSPSSPPTHLRSPSPSAAPLSRPPREPSPSARSKQHLPSPPASCRSSFSSASSCSPPASSSTALPAPAASNTPSESTPYSPLLSVSALDPSAPLLPTQTDSTVVTSPAPSSSSPSSSSLSFFPTIDLITFALSPPPLPIEPPLGKLTPGPPSALPWSIRTSLKDWSRPTLPSNGRVASLDLQLATSGAA